MMRDPTLRRLDYSATLERIRRLSMAELARRRCDLLRASTSDEVRRILAELG